MAEKGSLDDSVRYLKGVGEKRAAYFKKLEVETVYDLLHFYPRDYLDFSSPTPIFSISMKMRKREEFISRVRLEPKTIL